MKEPVLKAVVGHSGFLCVFSNCLIQELSYDKKEKAVGFCANDYKAE